MKKNKKAFLILIITIAAVLVVGSIVTTYAWFLSRYTHEYAFELKSESPIIIKYERDLVFDSEVASENVLIPATAKDLVGSDQQALTAIDVFDESLVENAAQAVLITADGAYWAGEVSEQTPKIGLFRLETCAYTESFLASQELEDHLEDFTEVTSVTEENLLSLLSAERSAYASAPAGRMLERNNLLANGELDAFVVIEYMGESILYFHGAYYRTGLAEGADLTLPASVEPNNELRYWHLLTANVDEYEDTEFVITDGSNLRMQPNTTFTLKLYAFIAKTDEELDPNINGETISIFVALTIQEE